MKSMECRGDPYDAGGDMMGLVVGATFMTPDNTGSMNRTPTELFL